MARREAGAVAVAAGVCALAALALWQTSIIPVSPIFARVGPTVFPWAVAGALSVCGLLLVVQAWAGQLRAEDALSIDWRGVGLVALGLALNAALIVPLGFVFASAAMFPCVARGFGSRKPLRDLALGFGIALVAWLTFDKLLGINIGGGVLDGLL